MDFRDLTIISALTGGLGTQIMENDSSGRVVYLGTTEPGSSEDSLRWQIKKLTYDASGFITNVQFAQGSNEFKYSWTLRATYSYS